MSRAEPPDEPPVDNPPPKVLRRRTIEAAAKIIARRRAARRTDLDNPAGWIYRTAQGIERDRAGDGHRHLFDNPRLTPAELADLLEPPPDVQAAAELEQQRAAAEQAAEQSRRRVRDTLAQPADRPRNLAGVQAARAQHPRYRRPET